jgi:glycosyltransferase involved in cell wall biosynthesis
VGFGGLQVKSPRITVVIPTYNSMSKNKRLDLVLEALTNQTLPPWEVVVVDNYSTDSTPEVAKRFGARVFQTTGNIARANNYAISKATGDYLFFLDSDQIVPKGFIEECQTLIENRNCDAIGYTGLFVNDNESNMSTCVYLRNIEILLGREPSEGIYFYSRELIGAQRFDENLPVMEDYYFRQKIMARRPTIGYVEAPLLHVHDSTFRWFIRRSLDYGKIFRRTVRGDARRFSATTDYFVFTKKMSTDTRVSVPVKPAALLFPFFLLVKYMSFGIGFFAMSRLDDK